MKKVGKKELLSLISEQVEIHEKQSKNSQKKRQQKARKKAVDRRTSVDNDKKLKATIVGVLNKIQKGKEGLQQNDRKKYLINVLKLIKGEETPINESEEESTKKAKEVVNDQKDELSDDKVKDVVVDKLEQVFAPFANNDANKDNDQPAPNTEVDMDEIKKQAIAFTTQYIVKGKYDEVIKVLNDQFENFRDKISDDSSDSEDPEIPQPIIEEEAEDLDPSLEDDGTGDGGDIGDSFDISTTDANGVTKVSSGEKVDHTYKQFLTKFLDNNIDSTTNDDAAALRAELLKFLLGEFQQDKYKNYTSLDSIMQRGLIAYDKKMAAKKEKIDDADAKLAHDQRVKNVRDAFVRSFMKKKPKFKPNEETKEVIKQGSADTESTEETEPSEEDVTSPAADIVKQAFGDLIDANKKGSAFKPLVQMVERIAQIFKDSLKKSKTANDKYLSEPKSPLQEITGNKTFRRFFMKKVAALDSFWSGTHEDLISDIVTPIYKQFELIMDDAIATGEVPNEPMMNVMNSIIDSSKVVFNEDDDFNKTVGKISRYFLKLEKTGNFNKAEVLEKLAKGIITSLRSEVADAFGSRDSATERGEKKTAADDKRVNKLANILKALQGDETSVSTDDETLDSDDENTWTEALEDVKTKSKESYQPKEWDYDFGSAQDLIRYLVNTYAANPTIELGKKILENVEGYIADIPTGKLESQLMNDKLGAEEIANIKPIDLEGKDRQPFYWVDVEDVMNRFFKFIKEIEVDRELTQEAFGMEKLKSFIEKSKDKSDLYKAMKLLKDPTKFNLYSVFEPEEQKTIMWHLSDKKRFGQFMNRFSGDPLFKKVVNSKLGLFGKLFSRWNSYKFDDKGKLIKQQSNNKTPVSTRSTSQNKPSGPTMDLGGLNDPPPSEYGQIQEALKPIIDNMIKEILNK